MYLISLSTLKSSRPADSPYSFSTLCISPVPTSTYTTHLTITATNTSYISTYSETSTTPCLSVAMVQLDSKSKHRSMSMHYYQPLTYAKMHTQHNYSFRQSILQPRPAQSV
ncbi:hypothetical protein RND81_11G061400 [Saponaria officinalis]|uniref:Uncharacterized protein n=1 Tax=Saponaria officinalis TaxID=3572 RepID=A0AAW1HIR7_SAPOF